MWSNNSWQPANLYTYSYNSGGNLDTMLSQAWNGTLQAYVNQTKEVYTYDANQHLINYLLQTWNAGANVWEPYMAYSYVYNDKGFVLDYSLSLKSLFTNVFGLIQHYVYYPDNMGNIDSSYEVNYDYNDSTRFYYTYYSSNSKTSQVIKNEYQLTGSPIGSNLTLHFYDTTGNVFTDSVVGKKFVSTPEGTAVSSITVTQQSFNEYGQQTHFLSKTVDGNGVFQTGREDFLNYSVCSSVALPVTLINFTGVKKNNDALLQWQTSNEINTSYFNLQRSTDGVHFTTVGKIMASGINSLSQRYAYTDADISLLNSAQVYYRLVITDNNRAITYSKIIMLTINSNKLSITLSPNPIQNTIYLYSPVSITGAQVKVADMNGAVLYTCRHNIIAGERLSIDASGFAKGIYIITVQSQTDKQTFKLIK